MTMFEFSRDLPEDLVELFAARHAGAFNSIGEEPEVGWVTGRHLLDNDINGESCQIGGCYYFNLRKAEKKIPAALLNAICRKDEFAYMQENQMDFVPSKIRRQIKEQAKERYLGKMLPALSGIPVAIHPHEKFLILGASSRTQQEYFIENFMNTVKNEPLPINPGYWLEKFFQTTETSMPTINWGADTVPPDEPMTGRDFLTYLWYAGENGIKVKHSIYGEFEVMVEGPLSFALERESYGAQEITVKKGENPMRSAEAKAALAAGKRLKKAKLHIARLDQAWSCTFDADNFAFGSVKLPEGENMNRDEIFADRMENILVFKGALEEYFKLFAQNCLSPEFDKFQRQLKDWAAGIDGV